MVKLAAGFAVVLGVLMMLLELLDTPEPLAETVLGKSDEVTTAEMIAVAIPKAITLTEYLRSGVSS